MNASFTRHILVSGERNSTVEVGGLGVCSGLGLGLGFRFRVRVRVNNRVRVRDRVKVRVGVTFKVERNSTVDVGGLGVCLGWLG